MMCALALEMAKGVDSSITVFLELLDFLPYFFFFSHFCLQKILRYFGKLTVDFKKMAHL